jgi:hypothetical protein
MRRPTTVLLLAAVAIVAIALLLRSGDDSDTTTTTPPPSGAPETDAGSPTTEASPTTEGPTPPTTITPIALPPGTSVCDLYSAIEVTGTIQSSDLVEASGMAVSRTQDGILWAHNDSRGGPTLFAFTPEGTDLGSFELDGAFAIDWEDMGAGPAADGTGAFLYVGDMGDNFGIRDGVITVWRVPDVSPTSLDGSFVDPQAIVYRLPGGPFDAEALFVDPVDPALYVITKSRSEAFVFRGPLEPASEPHDMELVATLFLDAEVSGADISADGGLLALRGYGSVWLWPRLPGETIVDALAGPPCLGPSPDERQGEAIAIDRAWSYLTVSEGTTPPINYVPADR